MYSLCSALSFVTSLLLILPTLVQSQASNQTVSAEDSSIDYVGSGWTSSAGHMFTNSAGSFSFDFTGSAIYWFSRRQYDGALATVSVDGSSVTVDTSAGMSQDTQPVVSALFSRTGLDASQSHRLTVTWKGIGGNGVGQFLENWQLVFTSGSDSSPVTTTTPNPSPVTSSSPDPPPPPSPQTSTSSRSPSTSSPNTIPSASTSISTSSRLITSVLSGSTFVSTSDAVFTFTVSANPSAATNTDLARGSSSVGTSTSGTSTESAAATAQPGSHQDLGATIGGTVGGIVAVIGLIIAIFYIRWRRKRLAAEQNSQSATPFYVAQGRVIAPPDDPHLRNPKNSLPSENQSPLQQRSAAEPVLLLVDPVTLRPVGEGVAMQLSSQSSDPSASTSVSPPSFARGLKWVRAPSTALIPPPSFTQRLKWVRAPSPAVQSRVSQEPQDAALSSSSNTVVVGNYEMSDRAGAVALVPVPMSPGNARQRSPNDDPPPEYRR